MVRDSLCTHMVDCCLRRQTPLCMGPAAHTPHLVPRLQRVSGAGHENIEMLDERQIL